MEKNNLWFVFVIILIAIFALGFIYTNSNLTGKAAIQNPPTILPVSCTDNDGGWNLSVKGTCTDSNHSYNDSCFMQGNTTFLREYYCMSGYCQSTPYNCAALGSGVKCIDGACLSNMTNQITTLTSSITTANLKQLKPNEIFDYARASKKLIMQEGLPHVTSGEYSYTVHIRNNDEQFVLLMLRTYSFYPEIICSPDGDPCTNPYTFTDPEPDFDIIYIPLEVSYAVIVQGVHYSSPDNPNILGPISKHIEIDYSKSKEISIPNNRSYFINAGVDYPPQGSVATFGINDPVLGNIYWGIWISQPDIVPLRLYAKDAINKNYSVELGLGGTKRVDEFSSRLLMTSVMFTYPFNKSVNIPPKYSTRYYKAYRSITNSPDDSPILVVNGLAGCFYPTNMNNSDCLWQGQGRQWQVGDNISWTAIVGQVTPFFQAPIFSRYFEMIEDIYVSYEHPHIDIYASLENVTGGTWLQPPYKLGTDIMPTIPHCGPGIYVYSTDINRNKMYPYGWIDGKGSFNATTPGGRQIYENTFYPYLTCGYENCDRLGPCEQGKYTFYFDMTGFFLDPRQRPCLRAEAFYDENAHGFTIISQRPGQIVNGRCVFMIPEYSSTY